MNPCISIRKCGALLLLAVIGVPSHGQTLGDALNAPDLVWTTGGAASWQVDTNISHDGQASVNTGNLAFTQTNWIATSIAGPTALTFWYKTSTCDGYGTLSLFIGGTLQMSSSGDLDWQQGNFYVPAGNQPVLWAFDLYCTSPILQNMAWLDQVVLSNPAAPTVTTQPTNQTVIAGNPASLAVTVEGTAPFIFQWQRYGTNVAGAMSNVLSMVDMQAANAGDYTLLISVWSHY